jgi:mannose-6-phosphate isomerase-like protein (cupin superfamily)
MNITRKNSAPRYRRDNIESFLLVSEITGGAKNLAVTLVEMEPDGVQHVHVHGQEQAYCILEGSGVMTVSAERGAVKEGDCVFIPSNASHGLENTGGTVLRYLSVASPSFAAGQCKELWAPARLDEDTGHSEKV